MKLTRGGTLPRPGKHSPPYVKKRKERQTSGEGGKEAGKVTGGIQPDMRMSTQNGETRLPYTTSRKNGGTNTRWGNMA